MQSLLPRAKVLVPSSRVIGQTRSATSLGLSIQRPTPRLPTKYGGVYSVTLIPGDGIGTEITQSVEEIFEHLNVPVEFERFDISGATSQDAALFKRSMDSLRRNKVGLKGILYTPVERSGHTSWNVAMRQQLDIYASVVLCKSVPGFPTRHRDVDFAIIRENTEGEYSGLEHQSSPGVVESLKIMTRAKSERIARFAFDFAIKNNRKTVTCVHKANIMKLGDGLFLNTCRQVAEEYKDSGIKFNDMIVDNASMQACSRPQQFDVMVLPNLYGSILGNIGAATVGGPGIVPGANIGRDYALFEPGCRHVAKDIEGQDVANPSAMILSATMMLRHLGLDHHANQIAAAVYKVIADGTVKTPDMGGEGKTTEFTAAVLKAVA
ncbi:isocitrate dehydrogenase [NAD] subunit 1 [Microbotryum lychnidis-dioicae p1A1 Lamole]|uniref:Isocitrate dehydrogenase [NAD] subunit 1, mitochondrial n=1 Tax=Microbotryum lychnidis-dioicae (strain p1A1 Lamole / MvSl-1064) TaxID=683840 RepID=U5H136_USTV1|nr:isocitrate dehydrogenase [NAD] subunit 1 [Microbotryum lychnidis-dioicae p1A1 Lamole]|eukprot:KDE08639.1 isocitrate dehydrogenase [NAD] subunit 1 [Microbotryum lychnidis-dioicae p1A1 Lamole]